MIEKTKPAQHEPVVNDDEALLKAYNFADLPEAYSDRSMNITNVREPLYLCRGEVFLGEGKSGTWYAEDAILIYKYVPNDLMQPLNRAAGVRFARWLRSLPTTRVQFDIGDMSEASQILAKNPTVQSLTPVEYQATLIKLCEELKIRREGKSAMNLPGLNHNFAPQSGGNAPPILGAKQADMAQRGPGDLHGDAPRPTGGVRRAGGPSNISAGNALGGPNPI